MHLNAQHMLSQQRNTLNKICAGKYDLISFLVADRYDVCEGQHLKGEECEKTGSKRGKEYAPGDNLDLPNFNDLLAIKCCNGNLLQYYSKYLQHH